MQFRKGYLLIPLVLLLMGLLSTTVFAGQKNEVTVETSRDFFSNDLKSSYVYTGKAITPKLTVFLEEIETRFYADGTATSSDVLEVLRKNREYTVQFRNNKKIGTAAIIINGKGACKGLSKTLKFQIVPARASFTVKCLAGGLKLKIRKQPGGVCYQIDYRRAGASSWKSIRTSGTSVRIRGLKANKKYEVRVRAYKKVGGRFYRGDWSKNFAFTPF